MNPASYEYLCINIGINRLGGKVLPFCADGRAFMRQAAAGQLDLTAAAVVVPPPKPTKPKEKGSKGQQQQQQPAAGQQQQQTAQQQTAEQQQEGAAAAAVAAAAAPNGTTSRCFQHLVMNLPVGAVAGFESGQLWGHNRTRGRRGAALWDAATPKRRAAFLSGWLSLLCPSCLFSSAGGGGGVSGRAAGRIQPRAVGWAAAAAGARLHVCKGGGRAGRWVPGRQQGR